MSYLFGRDPEAPGVMDALYKQLGRTRPMFDDEAPTESAYFDDGRAAPELLHRLDGLLSAGEDIARRILMQQKREDLQQKIGTLCVGAVFGALCVKLFQVKQ